jgi:hypothetical protein
MKMNHVDVSKCLKGKMEITPSRDGGFCVFTGHIPVCLVHEMCSVETDPEKSYTIEHANALLIAEAFNVATETGMSPKQLQRLLQDIVACHPDDGQTEYDGKMERVCPYCGIIEWGKPHEDGCPFITARDALTKGEKGE